MIGPMFLRNELKDAFQKHLAQYPYWHLVRQGRHHSESEYKAFSHEEAAVAVDAFAAHPYPVVCRAGSKSKEPFFDFHIALGNSGRKGELHVEELLVRDPKESNIARAVTMACGIMFYKTFEVDQIWIPIRLDEARLGLDEVAVVYNPNPDETIVLKK